MKLKKLLIFGFKSFADKTALEFQPGLTAIVGPNGCGKSNVVDALRWVMGETQAKAIRGEKMFDVLFNGTKTRPKTSYAEVSLVFDEINGALNLPYEEVMVTRRLFSDGTSGYFLNKKEVRLKDIHALFANTGIGKNAFWVFEQGKIDQIVTMSPLELRTIFEDAAGISLYLTQKKEAKGRLKEVEQNLLRATDRINEKEKFIALLRKQKEDAENYKTAKNDLEVHEKGYFHKRLKAIDNKIEELKKSSEELTAECAKKEEALAQKEGLLKQSAALQETLQQEKEEKLASLYQLRNTIALLEEKRAQLVREREQKKERTNALEKEINTFLEQHPERRDQFETLEQHSVGVQDSYNQEKMALRTLEADVQELSQKERRLQESQFQLQKGIQKAQFDLKTLELKKEGSLKEKAECENALEALHSAIASRSSKKESQGLELQTLREEFEALKVELQGKQERLQQHDKKIVELDRQIQNEQRKLTEIQTKIHALHSLKNELDGSSSGTKELFKAFPGLKPLSDLLEIETDQAEMIANALHPYSHTLVAENREVLNSAIEYIKSHQLTNISITLLESEKLLKEIHIYETVDEAAEFPAWTRDGFWVTSNRLITRNKMGEHNAFMRQGEIKKLQKEVEKLSASKEKLDAGKLDLLAEKESFVAEIKESESKLKGKEIKLMELKYLLQNEIGELKKEEDRKQGLLHKLQQADALLQPIHAQKEHLDHILADQEQKLEAVTAELAEVQKVLEGLREQLQGKRTGLQQQEKELFSLISSKEKMKGEIQSNEYKHQQQLKMFKALQEELLEIERFLEKDGNSLPDLKLQLQDLEDLYNQKLFLFEENLKDLRLLKEEHAALLHDGLKDQLKNLEMRLFEQGVKRESLQNELVEKYNVQEVEPASFELSFDKYEHKIKELRAYLASLPSINLTAQEEHANEEKELLDLQQQIADLQTALQEVLKLIGELDTKSTTLFQETFRTVADHFRKNFQTLFNGGHAELVLKETADLLETEVEIRCEPPGKSLKSLQLLSGGEKCLTAIALLFALFQVKPAPMCLLDEIDAPLDESNAKRFLDLIEPFSKDTKIILVTHNKLTMERAHQLIGISMQEKGVTKVIDLVGMNVPAEAAIS